MAKILRARHGDIPKVKQIEIESGLSPWTETDYSLEIKRKESLFFVAEDKRRVVGFIVARLIMNYDYCLLPNEIEIYNIAVTKDFRRKNIASALLKEVLRIGFEKGFVKSFLEVRKSNVRAQNFYKKHSFKISGERKSFYTNPQEDAVLMSRFIKSI